MLVVMAAGAFTTCTERSWVVYISSDASRDVIARVDFPFGTRDALIRSSTEGELIALSQAQSPSVLTLLDPATCDVLASANLPAESVVAGFHDDPVSGQITLIVSAKDIQSGAPLPATEACSGQ